MSKNVLVEVFGVPNEFPAKSGCSCGPDLTMEEMYNEFLSQIQMTDVYPQMEINFINVKDVDMADYAYVNKALDAGFKLPLVAVEKRVRFHNAIPFNQIFRLAKQQLG